MAIEGKGEVSACGHENIGIGDLGSLRDDVTGVSMSEEEEVDILPEEEDIMVGVSGAEIFFDGIYEGQEEEDVIVREDDEDEFNNYEICIDDTLESKDYGLYDVQESGAATDEIVSCVRALVQSLPLPGQISPQELVPVNQPLVSSRHSFEETEFYAIDQPSHVLKRKHERIDVKPKECGSSSEKCTDLVACSSMPSRFQEFEEYLIASTNYPTAEDRMISQVEILVQTREDDQNKNSQKQLSKESKTELLGHRGCESSLVSPVKEIKDSYWQDMVIHTESSSRLLTADTTTTEGSNVYNLQSRRLGADHQNKHLRMKTSKYNHVLMAATTDKNSPAELILTFDHMQAIPSESKLNNIFRRFGTLREKETLIYQGCARVVFKKSSDAEVAVSSAKAFNIMGPSVVKYELGYTPFTAMPATGSEIITSVMQSAESEVINAQEYETEGINAQEYEAEDMSVQQMQLELLEETCEVDITVEGEEYEGLDDVDIME